MISLPRDSLINAALIFVCLFTSVSSNNAIAQTPTSAFWRNATVYFMLTDRFKNGEPENDLSYNRTTEPALLRGFEGGDIQGIIDKIEDGYFTDLGVDAIWMTPVIEQIHGYDDSSGITYSYHGYWPKDWTAVDANFGTEAQLAQMIKTAHAHNIRVLIDVIINHTGPATQMDVSWPDEWVRTRPICNWSSYIQNTQCAIATSLPDIKTESEVPVELPDFLLDKWQTEGRLEQELAELEQFFARTGYPRAPKYYIVKWLTDWVREYGVDGFRVDTAKHVEAEIWTILKKESEIAFAQYQAKHPQQLADSQPFYMVGEVMNWGILGFKNAVESTLAYDYGDKRVNFFDYGFDGLINIGFVEHVQQDIEKLYSRYSAYLNEGPMQGKGMLNYIGSHDDQDSFDRARKHNYTTAFKLMMAPGGVQIYYGDELARPMLVEGSYGDVGMRANMNWNDLSQLETQALLAHWQKLGKFRQQFPAVGAGVHQMLNASPYVFKRELSEAQTVVIAQGLAPGIKSIKLNSVFAEGVVLKDYYSGLSAPVKNNRVEINTPYAYLLLAPDKH
ncbi:alpha-amylase family glycosyl hydrolase [uncultured Alteromonas sp.]|uniref:alpha-amylase family glycosyl hydrolase n=1 Tax=uncultured Alteromonas sp. TaxID=179113 RepID=UPI0030EB9553|tara:strand:+ start:7872 stop:9551 length:1680 start_codon:yes stop_codon:yes gene_type:complete